MKLFLSCLFLSAFSVLILPAQARPMVPAEQRDVEYSGRLPSCDHSGVLSEIESGFKDRESSYWSSGLSILSFEGMQEIGFRPTGPDYVPRRYCRARVLMSDRQIRDVSYSIGEREGLIGFTWGAEWCISGLDRNYAFGIDCRSARP
jgi:hypothetical protein